ncbi:MAG: TlpA family protein disulfide reductase [Myxococcales bacterium]|nr:TlpA family protein disulfide reductase [Myxococcales bacterium]MCB9578942.1 TlpA family protein disulfide reductase [Polyangiaceae bacterium]
MRRRSHQPIRVRFLGRLSTLIALGAALSACDQGEKVPQASRSRSQAVVATATTSAAAPVVVPSATAKPEKPRKKLCEGQLAKPGKAFPEGKLARKAAAGAAALPTEPAIGKGWTWVNFWAAWCAPCKEEMPRLLSWQTKLRAAGAAFSVVFVSMDDDERQLSDFLAAQPDKGVRQSYWLSDEKERGEWLTQAGVDEDPDLPVHLLVDPSGKIRCTVSGAVNDSDYETVQKIVSGR